MDSVIEVLKTPTCRKDNNFSLKVGMNGAKSLSQSLIINFAYYGIRHRGSSTVNY